MRGGPRPNTTPHPPPHRQLRPGQLIAGVRGSGGGTAPSPLSPGGWGEGGKGGVERGPNVWAEDGGGPHKHGLGVPGGSGGAGGDNRGVGG